MDAASDWANTNTIDGAIPVAPYVEDLHMPILRLMTRLRNLPILVKILCPSW